jgi:hypothetical protein
MKYASKYKSGRRMQRFSDGGRLGYEEDPQPGMQTDRQDFQPGLKVDTKDKPKDQSRSKSKVVSKEKDKVNLMDDLAPRENLPSPDDNVTEGGPTQRNSPRRPLDRKRSSLPSDRATGFRDQVKESDAMSPEDREALKGVALGLAVPPAARALGMVGRGLQVAKRRYDIGRRVDAMTENQQKTAMMRAAREAREVDGMRSGGRVSGSSMGGSVRGGGCEIRGKTKGRMV